MSDMSLCNQLFMEIVSIESWSDTEKKTLDVLNFNCLQREKQKDWTTWSFTCVCISESIWNVCVLNCA